MITMYSCVMDIEAFLSANGITFQRYEHPAVFTCEEAKKLDQDISGTQTKNLLLRDRRGKRIILVVVGYAKNVDLKVLKDVVGADKLSFASPERLKKYLGVDPGAVSLLGLVNDVNKAVEVILDEHVWGTTSLQCHPLVNTATLVIPHEGIETFFRVTGHEYQVMDVPAK